VDHHVTPGQLAAIERLPFSTTGEAPPSSSWCVYTDGGFYKESHTGTTGWALFSPGDHEVAFDALHLPYSFSSTESECRAAYDALSSVQDHVAVGEHLYWATDSQALLDSLRSARSSPHVKDLQLLILSISETHSIFPYWVKGHANIRGNERADELTHVAESLPFAPGAISLDIYQLAVEKSCPPDPAKMNAGLYQGMWAAMPPPPKKWHSQTRTVTKTSLRLRTGHSRWEGHLMRIGIIKGPPACPGCLGLDMSITHILTNCMSDLALEFQQRLFGKSGSLEAFKEDLIYNPRALGKFLELMEALLLSEF
jgi:ribonuclease HI